MAALFGPVAKFLAPIVIDKVGKGIVGAVQKKKKKKKQQRKKQRRKFQAAHAAALKGLEAKRARKGRQNKIKYDFM